MKTLIKKIIKLIFQWNREREIIPICQVLESDKLLEGKVALIAGGSGGIGLAITKKFLASGCKVIISGTNISKLEAIKHNISSNNLEVLQLDYATPKTFNSKVEEAVHIFGKIDVFVSSTGIHNDREGLDFINISIDEYDSIMDINLKGTYFMCQSVAQYMISNHIRGHILLVSSQSALEPSWSPYRLSKLGIEGITKGMAQRLLEQGIIVNAIGPGPSATSMQKNYKDKNIYTHLNPAERYTMPEEVAEFVKMMVSDLGNTIIGDTLYMSGGRGIIDIR